MLLVQWTRERCMMHAACCCTVEQDKTMSLCPDTALVEGRAGQGRAGQGRAGQGRAGQGRAGQGRAGRGGAGQGRARDWHSNKETDPPPPNGVEGSKAGRG